MSGYCQLASMGIPSGTQGQLTQLTPVSNCSCSTTTALSPNTLPDAPESKSGVTSLRSVSVDSSVEGPTASPAMKRGTQLQYPESSVVHSISSCMSATNLYGAHQLKTTGTSSLSVSAVSSSTPMGNCSTAHPEREVTRGKTCTHHSNCTSLRSTNLPGVAETKTAPASLRSVTIDSLHSTAGQNFPMKSDQQLEHQKSSVYPLNSISPSRSHCPDTVPSIHSGIGDSSLLVTLHSAISGEKFSAQGCRHTSNQEQRVDDSQTHFLAPLWCGLTQGVIGAGPPPLTVDSTSHLLCKDFQPASCKTEREKHEKLIGGTEFANNQLDLISRTTDMKETRLGCSGLTSVAQVGPSGQAAGSTPPAQYRCYMTNTNQGDNHINYHSSHGPQSLHEGSSTIRSLVHDLVREEFSTALCVESASLPAAVPGCNLTNTTRCDYQVNEGSNQSFEVTDEGMNSISSLESDLVAQEFFQAVPLSAARLSADRGGMEAMRREQSDTPAICVPTECTGSVHDETSMYISSIHLFFLLSPLFFELRIEPFLSRHPPFGEEQPARHRAKNSTSAR